MPVLPWLCRVRYDRAVNAQVKQLGAAPDGVAAEARAIFGAVDSLRAEEAARIVERYATAYVELGSWAAAYRRCYDCSNMKATTVWNNAHALSNYPGMRERVRDLYAKGAERSIVSIAEALRHQLEVALANPSELAWTTKHACRHCWGFDNAYQWRTQDEHTLAVAAELDAAVSEHRTPKVPDDAGGYGYTIHRPPNPECEHCAGAGQTVNHVADTRSLSGPAAKLYKGTKVDRHGIVTIEMHDQQRAWDAVNRILGAYKDTTLLLNPATKPAEAIAPDVPKERVADAYARLIG